MSAEVIRTKRVHFPSLPPPPFTTTNRLPREDENYVMEAFRKHVLYRRREKDTGPPYSIRYNEEGSDELFATDYSCPPPLPDIVDPLSPGVWVETDEENTDPPYGIPHNEEGRYETFEVYSYTFPEAPTDLSAFMAGVTLRENPVRLRSTSRRPDG